MSVGTTLLHPVPAFTIDPLLAAVFGGIILGVGVGMVIRYGGSLDGTEIVAILLNKKSPFSVGEIVMFFNLFILASGLRIWLGSCDVFINCLLHSFQND